MTNNDNSCLIDVISKEAIIKNRAKLKKVKVETVPYVVSMTNSLSGIPSAHACMLFYYKGDTWHYDNSTGSTRAFRNKKVKNVLTVAKKVFSLQPWLKIDRAYPLEYMDNFPEEARILPNKYIND